MMLTTAAALWRASLEAYDSLGPAGKPQPSEWTVLATIAATLSNGAIAHVLSIGTGVKCIGASGMQRDGSVVNDSHAEVLARRAFKRYIFDEIALHRSRCRCVEGAAAAAAVVVVGSCTFGIFEHDADASPGSFRLRSGVALHLCVSDSPCGDAAIYADDEPRINARFGHRFTGAKPRTVADAVVSPSAIATPTPPAPTVAQFSTGGVVGPSTAQTVGALRIKSGRSDITPERRTLSMSCSDKIARWAAIGIQGALAMHELQSPLFLSSVIVCGGAAQLSTAADAVAAPSTNVVFGGPVNPGPAASFTATPRIFAQVAPVFSATPNSALTHHPQPSSAHAQNPQFSTLVRAIVQRSACVRAAALSVFFSSGMLNECSDDTRAPDAESVVVVADRSCSSCRRGVKCCDDESSSSSSSRYENYSAAARRALDGPCCVVLAGPPFPAARSAHHLPSAALVSAIESTALTAGTTRPSQSASVPVVSSSLSRIPLEGPVLAEPATRKPSYNGSTAVVGPMLPTLTTASTAVSAAPLDESPCSSTLRASDAAAALGSLVSSLHPLSSELPAAAAAVPPSVMKHTTPSESKAASATEPSTTKKRSPCFLSLNTLADPSQISVLQCDRSEARISSRNSGNTCVSTESSAYLSRLRRSLLPVECTLSAVGIVNGAARPTEPTSKLLKRKLQQAQAPTPGQARPPRLEHHHPEQQCEPDAHVQPLQASDTASAAASMPHSNTLHATQSAESSHSTSQIGSNFNLASELAASRLCKYRLFRRFLAVHLSRRSTVSNTNTGDAATAAITARPVTLATLASRDDAYARESGVISRSAAADDGGGGGGGGVSGGLHCCVAGDDSTALTYFAAKHGISVQTAEQQSQLDGSRDNSGGCGSCGESPTTMTHSSPVSTLCACSSSGMTGACCTRRVAAYQAAKAVFHAHLCNRHRHCTGDGAAYSTPSALSSSSYAVSSSAPIVVSSGAAATSLALPHTLAATAVRAPSAAYIDGQREASTVPTAACNVGPCILSSSHGQCSNGPSGSCEGSRCCTSFAAWHHAPSSMEVFTIGRS